MYGKSIGIVTTIPTLSSEDLNLTTTLLTAMNTCRQQATVTEVDYTILRHTKARQVILRKKIK